MSDATLPWERMPDETPVWFDRLQRFLFLGVTRSIYKAYVTERKEKKGVTGERLAKRTGLPQSWRKAAFKYKWRERAQAFDEEQQRIRDAYFAARQDEILRSGFAQRHQRIQELNRLAELLRTEVWTEDARWLPDVKQIGSGKYAERVDIVRFNASLVEQYRQTLEDIAIEMGERVRGLKVSGSMGIVPMTADDLAHAKNAAQQAEQELLEQM